MKFKAPFFSARRQHVSSSKAGNSHIQFDSTMRRPRHPKRTSTEPAPSADPAGRSVAVPPANTAASGNANNNTTAGSSSMHNTDANYTNNNSKNTTSNQSSASIKTPRRYRQGTIPQREMREAGVINYYRNQILGAHADLADAWALFEANPEAGYDTRQVRSARTHLQNTLDNFYATAANNTHAINNACQLSIVHVLSAAEESDRRIAALEHELVAEVRRFELLTRDVSEDLQLSKDDYPAIIQDADDLLHELETYRVSTASALDSDTLKRLDSARTKLQAIVESSSCNTTATTATNTNNTITITNADQSSATARSASSTSTLRQQIHANLERDYMFEEVPSAPEPQEHPPIPPPSQANLTQLVQSAKLYNIEMERNRMSSFAAGSINTTLNSNNNDTDNNNNLVEKQKSATSERKGSLKRVTERKLSLRKNHDRKGSLQSNNINNNNRPNTNIINHNNNNNNTATRPPATPLSTPPQAAQRAEARINNEAQASATTTRSSSVRLSRKQKSSLRKRMLSQPLPPERDSSIHMLPENRGRHYYSGNGTEYNNGVNNRSTSGASSRKLSGLIRLRKSSHHRESAIQQNNNGRISSVISNESRRSVGNDNINGGEAQYHRNPHHSEYDNNNYGGSVGKFSLSMRSMRAFLKLRNGYNNINNPAAAGYTSSTSHLSAAARHENAIINQQYAEYGHQQEQQQEEILYGSNNHSLEYISPPPQEAVAHPNNNNSINIPMPPGPSTSTRPHTTTTTTTSAAPPNNNNNTTQAITIPSREAGHGSAALAHGKGLTGVNKNNVEKRSGYMDMDIEMDTTVKGAEGGNNNNDDVESSEPNSEENDGVMENKEEVVVILKRGNGSGDKPSEEETNTSSNMSSGTVETTGSSSGYNNTSSRSNSNSSSEEMGEELPQGLVMPRAPTLRDCAEFARNHIEDDGEGMLGRDNNNNNDNMEDDDTSSNSMSMEMLQRRRTSAASFSTRLYPKTKQARTEAISDAGVMLTCSRVIGDGRCLFRSIIRGKAVALGEPIPKAAAEKKLADKLRYRAVAELRRHKTLLLKFYVIEENFDKYIERMNLPRTYAGEPELLMLAKALRMPIAVYLMLNGMYRRIQLYGKHYQGNPIRIRYVNDTHYDALIPTTYPHRVKQ